jgi:hypothetical protein
MYFSYNFWLGEEFEELVNGVKGMYPNLRAEDAIPFAKLLLQHEAMMKGNMTIKDSTPVPFQCKIIKASDEVPNSVHKLLPGDIKVVAALGDSLT